MPCSIRRDDGQLAGLDAAAVALAGPMGIAVVTGRDEVRRIVVVLVPVQMVGDQGALCDAGAWKPLDGLRAPVARVDARPDLVVEHKPAFGDRPRRGRE